MRPDKWKTINVGDNIQVKPKGGKFSAAKILSVDESGSAVAILLDSEEEVAITSLRQIKINKDKTLGRDGEKMQIREEDASDGEFGIMELARRTKAADPEGKGVSVLTLRKYIWERRDAADLIPHRKVLDTSRPGKSKALFTEESIVAALKVKGSNANKWGPIGNRSKAAG